MVEVLAGDLAAAEETLHAGYRQLEEMGGTGLQVNGHHAGPGAAAGPHRRGRGADPHLRAAGRPEQADAQVKWRSIRAIAMAAGRAPEPSGWPGRPSTWPAGPTSSTAAEAHLDLAEVLLLGGRGREAAHELDRAIPLFQEKGNEVGERNARRLLARTRS